jgi:WD40 repeat protein
MTTPTCKPENLLLATLNDFSIGGIAIPVVSVDATDDGRVIIGAGADCTVKIWRTTALETDSIMSCSRSIRIPNCSRLYEIRTIRNTKSFVAGMDDRIGIFQTDHSLPIAVSPIHEYGHPLALENFDTDLSSCVIAACERKGGILCWDTRINTLAWSLERDPLKYMTPTGLVLSKDAKAFLIASLNGYITVYDHRYLKPVSNFAVSSPSGISSVCPSATDNGRNIWVCTGSDICLFDVTGDALEPKHVLSTVPPHVTLPPPTLSKCDATLNTDFNISKISKSETNARCIKECAGSKNAWTVVSGHNDGVARYWQPGDQTSGIICPLQLDPKPAIVSGNTITQQVVRDKELYSEESQAYAGRPCTVTEGHRDVINDICFASLQCDVIVTAGRDGVVKLWK